MRFGGNHVGIVRGPIADADLAVFPDDFFESDLRPGGRVEQRVARIRGCPLRSGDEILAASFRAVSAAARLHQARYQSLLLIFGNRIHEDSSLYINRI